MVYRVPHKIDVEHRTLIEAQPRDDVSQADDGQWRLLFRFAIIRK
jgi:hypothetical protein